MEVNRELPNLGDGLADSVHLLTPGGRVLVLAYHSLEDRLVKQQFAQWAGTAPRPRSGHIPRGLPAPAGPEPVVRLLTRKPLRPDEIELEENPRASSVRLRAAERLSS
jgi:16S rRNA (cytosine1402-N4)-methyltransferase